MSVKDGNREKFFGYSCDNAQTREELFMPRTWQTDEVIRCLADADQDELRELIEEAEDEAAEALQEWVREGNARHLSL
jgi:hypothetical protein